MLETVLYYGAGEEDAMERFYTAVLRMRPIGKLAGRQLFFRAGSSVFLLFNRETTVVASSPPAHGASGSVHTCFVVAESSYDDWKARLSGRVVQEIVWPRGGRSFYFHDPANNLLEIADRDIWPA